MEHIPQQAGLCSQLDYQVARWYAMPENRSLLPAYVYPHYAVPAAWGLPLAVRKAASFFLYICSVFLRRNKEDNCKLLWINLAYINYYR